MRRKIYSLQVIIIFLSIYTPSLFAKENIHLTLAIHNARLPIVEKALEQTPCAEVKQFAKTWDRVLTEFFLLCKALHIGGLNPTFEFKGYPNYVRMLKEAKEGEFIMMAFAPWTRDADETLFYISDEVLRLGEFEVGLFTLPEHTELLKVRTLEELRQFKAISSKNWVVDWATLEHMKIKKYSVARYSQMFKMIRAKRGDFMLNAFSQLPDMSRTSEGIKLIPVPHIKISLKGTRRFFVYKQFPNARKVFDALQRGLKELRKKGLIRKSYEETGFYHPRVRNWKLLCCE